jgi:hypothetical protein
MRIAIDYGVLKLPSSLIATRALTFAASLRSNVSAIVDLRSVPNRSTSRPPAWGCRSCASAILHLPKNRVNAIKGSTHLGFSVSQLPQYTQTHLRNSLPRRPGDSAKGAVFGILRSLRLSWAAWSSSLDTSLNAPYNSSKSRSPRPDSFWIRPSHAVRPSIP